MSPPPLLGADDPAPVLLHRPAGGSPFFFTADHAGRAIPRRLGDLGLPERERARHIGWDIGIWAVTTRLADALDAFAIGQAYSRLVIDSNRVPEWPTAIPTISEATEVPGNRAVGADERAARVAEIFRPYHDRLTAELDRRAAAGMPTLYVAMHSFTPAYLGAARPWHVGVLHHRDARTAAIMLDLLRAEPGLVVGDNQPYAVSDESDHSLPRHAERRGLPCLELEIRQDLIDTEPGQTAWADRLARLLPLVWQRIAT
jgi:predicted N-formylglutamate amidohydrolase